ncbi:hypothetical protein RB199_35210 [Streptomyces libani]|uniref:hypothetical protein n=1 Tax=Streptomyces TaxID=1883 RepID=UPI000823EBA5|nr:MULTISPECIES: hypothetical protein [Streptomyces]AWN28826.1 hypothetical protein DKG71_24235 [Streptomyces sp. NEAU-S7GS2]MCX5451294.1 hypothetical protein [Streptomyces libani]MYT17040.1 hypothetical protein [Streptomyces sp. SID4951]WDT56879.1 hypothetical protein NUT86_24090 [Streptomyces sp. G7(2002)]SCK39391.1 hypothetical protein YWIDRAFT_06634 [Streptomyces sp. SceaMP-e96]
MAEYASRDAAAALARAKELGSTVRNGTKWYVRYQVIYGCAAAVMVLSVGLLAPPYGVAIGTGIWVATIVALSVYAARQRVARRGFGRRHAGLITVWALLFLAVLIPGTLWHQGAASWWVPGAVVVALPGLIGGYLEARR